MNRADLQPIAFLTGESCRTTLEFHPARLPSVGYPSHANAARPESQ